MKVVTNFFMQHITSQITLEDNIRIRTNARMSFQGVTLSHSPGRHSRTMRHTSVHTNLECLMSEHM